MSKRLILIESPARLTLKQQQLWCEGDGQQTRTIPIEDLGILILHHAQITITAPLLSALAEGLVAVVSCNEQHLPVGLQLPLAGHHRHTHIVRAQATVSLPARKQLWRQIICAKIKAQGQVAEYSGRDDRCWYDELAATVRSGDPENSEATAARRYFGRVFGEGFRREAQADGDWINSALNYGYAVVRAAVARAIVGAGLHPSLSLWHSNQYNSYALADDLMEPLRPMVDLIVLELVSENRERDDGMLTSRDRQCLAGVMTQDVTVDGQPMPIFTALERMTASLRDVMMDDAKTIQIPMTVV